MKKPPALQVEAIDGDQFPDRDSAQEAALESLSENLRAVIHDLLKRGVLLVDVDGKIIPNPQG